MEPVKIKPLKSCPKTGKKLTEEQLKWDEAIKHHFPKEN